MEDNNSVPSTPPIDNSPSMDTKKEKDAEAKKPPSSVKEFGVWADQNMRHRRRMEDAHYTEDGFNGDPTQGFFAVYDGHGGKEAAIFASQNFHLVLAEQLKKAGNDVVKTPEKVLDILKTTFAETDNKMKDVIFDLHIKGKAPERHLFVGNAGDARAVLCRDGKAIRLTYEHKAADETEAKRIQSVGGFIINGRVNGQIVITRSLGDHLMKDYIISEPYVQHEKLTDKDTFLIIACDGLWDVVSDQAAVDFVTKHGDSEASELSKRLLVKAIQDGSTDNLSVMVVKL